MTPTHRRTRALEMATAMSLVAAASLATALSLVPCEAGAQSRTAGATPAAARRAFERGVTALQLGRYGDALIALRESYELRASPVVLYNIGLALRGLGRYREAIESFDRYVHSPERGAAGERLSVIRDEIAQMRRSLVRVIVHVRPASATLSIDGRAQTLDQNAVEADPGTHALEIAAPGFRPFREERTWRAGSELVLDVQLEASNDGRIVVTPSVPDARIAIDGRAVGTGRADESVTPGTHVIEVSAPGYETFRRTARVGAAGTVRVDAVLGRGGGGGVAAALLIGGSLLLAGGVVTAIVVANGAQGTPYNATWTNVQGITLP